MPRVGSSILSQERDLPKRRGAWIRYRTELRHRHTNELLHRVDSDIKQDRENESLGDDPVLELITRYDATEFKLDSKSNSWLGQSAASAPSYTLRILSIAIINALQSIVKYYPGQKLSGNVVEVAWPYAILVHHYDELKGFKAACLSKDVSELCARERDVPEHIDRLIQFLDDSIMERVKAEQNRLKKGFNTFENLWIAYRPGRTAGDLSILKEWKPYVVSGISGGSFVNPPIPWTIQGWTLDFNGTFLGRREFRMDIPRLTARLSSRQTHTSWIMRPTSQQGPWKTMLSTERCGSTFFKSNVEIMWGNRWSSRTVRYARSVLCNTTSSFLYKANMTPMRKR